MKVKNDTRCQLCKQHEATIDFLISRCPILEINEYLMRYDRVGAQLRCSICRALGNGSGETPQNKH
jgi:hypothetical protein